MTINQQIIDWTKQQLAVNGYAITENPKIVREMPWSKVSCFRTPKGSVYLKQMIAPFTIEPKILQFLFKYVSNAVTEVIAVNEKLSCFLMKDAGQVLRDMQKQIFQKQLFYRALKICAEIQISSISHIDSFIAMGIDDWRLAKLSKLYQEFMSREEILKADGLNNWEIEILQKLSPEVQILCEQLSTYGIPETIEHADFQDNNILIQGNHITISDWGDTCISHPFFSLASALNSAKRNHNLKKTDERYLQAQHAYLENWLPYGTIDKLYKAFIIAEKLRYFQFALSFSRIHLCIIADTINPYYGYMAEALRHFLLTIRE